MNLCTYTLTSSTQWKQSVKDDSSRTEFTLASQLQQLLLSNQMSELLNPIHELRTHCNEEHMPAPFSWAVQPWHDYFFLKMKSFIMKGAICSINETFFSCGHNDNLWVAPSQHKKSNFLNQTELSQFYHFKWWIREAEFKAVREQGRKTALI